MNRAGSVEPLHILADVGGHTAADVGHISLEEVTEPLVVIHAGGGVIGLDEGLRHGFLVIEEEGIGGSILYRQSFDTSTMR